MACRLWRCAGLDLGAQAYTAAAGLILVGCRSCKQLRCAAGCCSGPGVSTPPADQPPTPIPPSAEYINRFHQSCSEWASQGIAVYGFDPHSFGHSEPSDEPSRGLIKKFNHLVEDSLGYMDHVLKVGNLGASFHACSCVGPR
jgi:hypothetical protein